MNFLVDTNVLSEIRKGDKCDSNVAKWFSSVGDEQVFISVLVLGEIRRGIETIRSRDPTRGRVFEQWLAELRDAYADRVLVVDQKVADEWGRMIARRNSDPVDVLLAATAKANGMTFVTRNVSHVVGLGADVANPFGPSGRVR